MQTQNDALDTFNSKFSNATLDIELSKPRKMVRPDLLMNEKAAPDAKITSLSLVVDEDATTLEDLEEIVIIDPVIVIGGHDVGKTEHKAPNCMFFRAGDLLGAIEEHERLTRGNTEWFGGIDCHHIYFEGLHKQADGSYRVEWGS